MIPLKFPRAALSPWPSGERFFRRQGEAAADARDYLARLFTDREKMLPSLGIFWRREVFPTLDFFGKDAFSTLDFRERSSSASGCVLGADPSDFLSSILAYIIALFGEKINWQSDGFFTITPPSKMCNLHSFDSGMIVL